MIDTLSWRKFESLNKGAVELGELEGQQVETK